MLVYGFRGGIAHENKMLITLSAALFSPGLATTPVERSRQEKFEARQQSRAFSISDASA